MTKRLTSKEVTEKFYLTPVKYCQEPGDEKDFSKLEKRVMNEKLYKENKCISHMGRVYIERAIEITDLSFVSLFLKLEKMEKRLRKLEKKGKK